MAPPNHRKVAFSTKKKKEQLKEKRERKKNEMKNEFGVVDHRVGKKQNQKSAEINGNYDIEKINQQPRSCDNQSKGYDPNKYRLHFKKETNEDVERGKAISREPLISLDEMACEIDLNDVYKPGSALDMPKRPPWDYSLNREKVEANEEKYFKTYLDRIFDSHPADKISYFELNLETWRQLWRVLEMSDVILLITDIRHPALHFSPALYNYVVNDLKKHLILVLNKIDYAPPSLVVAWKHYFQEKFPELHIVCFTSMPKDDKDREALNVDPFQTTKLHKKRKKRAYTAVGPKQLLQVCEQIVCDKVNLSSWRDKIDFDAAPDDDDDVEDDVDVDNGSFDDDGDHDDNDDNDGDGSDIPQTGFEKYNFCQDDVLTIGCCGYPNVGKSSLINGLVGKKVVSVSRTPGHTKHFQTIFLTKNVKLCDSPGLVFPSLICKPLQVLSGIYPISQLREPYTTIRYLAERIPLPTVLGLKHPDWKPGNREKISWSAYLICDAWAEKRGFLTAKAARNDVYRAANHLLRMACEGRICLCMRPPGFTANKIAWSNHQETQEILKLQEMHKGVTDFKNDDDDDNDDGSGGDDDDDDGDDDDDNDRRNYESSNPYSLLAVE